MVFHRLTGTDFQKFTPTHLFLILSPTTLQPVLHLVVVKEHLLNIEMLRLQQNLQVSQQSQHWLTLLSVLLPTD